MSSSNLEKCSDDPCGRQVASMSSSSLEKCSDDPCGRQVTLEASRLELLRRASTQGDLDAWAKFQKSLEATVLAWLHAHPDCEVACRVHSERHLVSLAFGRLRQATIQGQVTCETLSGALVYLHASLNGAILETLRNSKRPEAVSSIWQDGEDSRDKRDLWDWLQARLPNRREQRLAYLLYHCGLEPSEILRCCPQESSDTHEVTRLRHVILKRLMYQSNR
jgi:hypothetical protein